MAAFTANQVATSTTVVPIPGLPTGTYSLALTAGSSAVTISNNPSVATNTGYIIPANGTVVITVSSFTAPTLYAVSGSASTLSWLTGA